MTTNSENSPSENPQGDQRRHHLSARVPEHVSRGVFSTGVLVISGATEFVLDFVQNLGQPAQVAARVVLPHATIPQFIEALRTNLDLYKNRFGEPPELPQPPPPERKPTLQELYDDLRVPDDVLAGAYANGVMIGHAASEFKFDFLLNLVPHPVVTSRVYLAAPHVPRLLQSLVKTFEDVQKRIIEQQRRQQDPNADTDAPPSPT
jgi:hypothetical protein